MSTVIVLKRDYDGYKKGDSVAFPEKEAKELLKSKGKEPAIAELPKKSA